MRHVAGVALTGGNLHYTKPSLSFEDQANLLINRGLIVEDKQDLLDYLKQVSYYRLSGYWYFYKQVGDPTNPEAFQPGTTFSMIRDHYEFDRSLRLLIMDALERIEVAIFRTSLVSINTSQFGPFGYSDKLNYGSKFSVYEFNKLISDIQEDEKRSKEDFVKRYRCKYTSEQYLPLWMATEFMTFRQLFTMYKNQILPIKQTISVQFQVKSMVLDSWLLTLNNVRNCCAHHARLWNRPLHITLKFPDLKRDPRWYSPEVISNNRIFGALTVIQYLLHYIQPENVFKTYLAEIITRYPNTPLYPMGMPTNWQSLPLWN